MLRIRNSCFSSNTTKYHLTCLNTKFNIQNGAVIIGHDRPFSSHKEKGKPILPTKEADEFIFGQQKKWETTPEAEIAGLESLEDTGRILDVSSIGKKVTNKEIRDTFFKDPIQKFKLAMETAVALQEDLDLEYEMDWMDKDIVGIAAEEEDLTAEELILEHEKMEWSGPAKLLEEALPTAPPGASDIPREALLNAHSDTRDCYFCAVLLKDKQENGKRGLEKYHLFNPMNVPLLVQYIDGGGAILSKRHSGNCKRHQRKISKVIKKAVAMGFFSWKHSNFRINSPFTLPDRLVDHHMGPTDPMGFQSSKYKYDALDQEEGEDTQENEN